MRSSVVRLSVPETPSMGLVRPEQHESGHVGLSAATVDALYYRSREPHQSWVRALEELSPRSDVHGWLKIFWEPGEPVAPVQRWMLYEVVDPLLTIEGELAIDREVLAELSGPHPRSEGHMCHDNVPGQFQCMCRKKLGRWKRGPCQLITLRQYQIFHETGLYANPFWCIEGENGGHQTSYSQLERQELIGLGREPDPPAPGSLPYAEPDGRTWRQIQRFNRLMAMNNNIAEYRETMGSGYREYKAEIEKEQRRQFVSFLGDQTREEADLFLEGIRKGEAGDLARTDTDWERVDELSAQDYIETGIMNKTRAYLPQLSR